MSNEPKTAPQASASNSVDHAAKSTTDTKPTIAVAPAPEKTTVEEKKS
jgi:hypothetical protein